MKNIVFLLLIIVVYSCSTTINFSKVNEPINNFSYTGSILRWENIYNYSQSDSINVVSWFKNRFSITSDQPNKISGQTLKESLPYKKAGYNNMNVILLLKEPCEVFFTIDFKENRYRVIVNKILWYPSTNLNLGYISTNTNMVMSLEELALKNNGYRSTFVKNSSKQVNDILSLLFTATPLEISDNW
jgi:hypothetical protein